MTSQPPLTTGPAIIALGSASQSADEQARQLRRCANFAGVAIIAVTAGERGFLTALATPCDRWIVSEVADVYGRPTDVSWLLRPDGTAVIDAAQLVTDDPSDADRNIRNVATSYGLGQLLTYARSFGAHTVIVAAEAFPGADCASGAANAAGARLTVSDGSGLKIGANELRNVTDVSTTSFVKPPHVVVLCDTQNALADSADADDFRAHFAATIRHVDPAVTPSTPYTAAQDGLAFGLAALFHAKLVAAVPYGVALHDPNRTVRPAHLLVGSPARLDRVTGLYASTESAVATHPLETTDNATAAAVHSAFMALTTR